MVVPPQLHFRLSWPKSLEGILPEPRFFRHGNVISKCFQRSVHLVVPHPGVAAICGPPPGARPQLARPLPLRLRRVTRSVLRPLGRAYGLLARACSETRDRCLSPQGDQQRGSERRGYAATSTQPQPSILAYFDSARAPDPNAERRTEGTLPRVPGLELGGIGLHPSNEYHLFPLWSSSSDTRTHTPAAYMHPHPIISAGARGLNPCTMPQSLSLDGPRHLKP